MIWSVWQIGRGGAVERVGTYTSGADARRVLRATILAGAAVDPDGEVSEARGVAPAHVTAIERAAEEWLATETTPTVPAPAAVIEIPEPTEEHPVDDGHPVGTGSTTEAARAVAAEEAAAQMQAVLDGARAAAAALDTRATRAEAGCVAATARADAAEGRETVLVATLRGRSEQLDAARRTIAKLRAELAATHPVVRVAAKPRRRARATETPLGTLFRRIDERARGIR